ncbi:aminoglycoside phosphotransferase family protein [Actinoplanes sp. Pm04-4]|uniref:Aminoglycoside phosphotransferase family protein n=1 Tax=Paractinoplanes pyxinae TaxID=2997416 RepID=A0ABT4AYY9_9ACTN|nr:aminoglycoside phosphotransferase family protein [Actinoplanes pyxinae]MCY1139447.1 aminoglycoside phosphotransferase family protein [Actinoplanes pyxinae]
MHADQLEISPATVRTLIDDQFPQWRHLAVRPLSTQGTVNAIFRLGDDLTARFPLQLRPGAHEWLRSEAEAAAELLGRTRFATPKPVALGEPGPGYPSPWSVQTWLPGEVVTTQTLGDAFALDLAEFITGVRAIDTRGRTFRGGGRGGDLKDHDDWMETCFERSESLLDVPTLRRIWSDLRDLPRGDHADLMTHGDLIPGNLLVTDGRLTGVLDVGGLGPADPALELVAAWHLLEDGPRATLRRALATDDLQWQRGQAWAFVQAMGLPWYYDQTNPPMAETGRRTLARIVASF